MEHNCQLNRTSGHQYCSVVDGFTKYSSYHTGDPLRALACVCFIDTNERANQAGDANFVIYRLIEIDQLSIVSYARAIVCTGWLYVAVFCLLLLGFTYLPTRGMTHDSQRPHRTVTVAWHRGYRMATCMEHKHAAFCGQLSVSHTALTQHTTTTHSGSRYRSVTGDLSTRTARRAPVAPATVNMHQQRSRSRTRASAFVEKVADAFLGAERCENMRDICPAVTQYTHVCGYEEVYFVY